MTIYEKIKMLRTARGMSQQRLADMTGYTDRSSIGKIEAGVIDIPLSKVEEFARALGVSPLYLMGFDDVDEDLSYDAKVLFDSLSPDARQQALSFLRYLATQDKE